MNFFRDCYMQVSIEICLRLRWKNSFIKEVLDDYYKPSNYLHADISNHFERIFKILRTIQKMSMTTRINERIASEFIGRQD